MDKQYLSCTAINNQNLAVYVAKKLTSTILTSFRLYIDGKFSLLLKPVSRSESNSALIYNLNLPSGFSFIPGNRYEVLTPHNFFVPINISFLARTKKFEEKYRYDGELGAIYSKKKTVFRVFSPFAASRSLILYFKGKWKSFVREKDSEHGIFEISLDGNYDKAGYLYEAEIFGNRYRVVDPYAFALSSNSRLGYVIDRNKIKAIPSNRDKLPKFENETHAVIYEAHVRDRTSLTSRRDRGTFAALSRGGEKNKDGFPLGRDYIASYGFTHVQLRPVRDYQTVNDEAVFDSYNWGYDPRFYFAPEGSYSTDPMDPYARNRELKELISSFHERGIRVNLDVVYNHLFSQDFNSLGLLCPEYYFRHNPDNTLSNGTGCGNDLESRNYRVKKLIKDSIRHWIDAFDIDGLRFDLMGILDVETIKECYEEAKARKNDFRFYGEGWDLYTNLPGSEKASRNNAYKIPFCGFFNDRFRDVVKGKSNASELSVRGYLLGDCNYRDGFKHVRLGSCVPLAFAPLFSSYHQSINYVQCHDDACLYDKIRIANPDAKESEVRKRIKRINVALLFALGVPFFSEGQEIGKSKSFNFNTYNAGDKINGFDYALAEKRKDRMNFLTDAIKRKKRFRLRSGNEYEELDKHRDFEDLNSGALKINYHRKDFDFYLIFNPTKETIRYDFPEDVRMIFSDGGDVSDSRFRVHLAILPGCSVNVFYKEKANGKLSKEDR